MLGGAWKACAASLGFSTTLSSLLSAERSLLIVLRLKVRHLRGATPTDFQSFLGCEMDFGADADEIILPASVAVLPLVNADAHLNKILIRYAEDKARTR